MRLASILTNTKLIMYLRLFFVLGEHPFGGIDDNLDRIDHELSAGSH
jgi:hypothetical protein